MLVPWLVPKDMFSVHFDGRTFEDTRKRRGFCNWNMMLRAIQTHFTCRRVCGNEAHVIRFDAFQATVKLRCNFLFCLQIGSP